VRGEFKVRSLSDVPGRLEQLKQVHVLGPTGEMVEKTVAHVRRAGSTYIMGPCRCHDTEEAATLRGGLPPSAACLKCGVGGGCVL